MGDMKEFAIKREGLPKMQAYVAKLAKRATKIGVPPITATITGYRTEEVKTERYPNDPQPLVSYVEYADVRIDGDTPKVEGWEFIARIEHDPTLGNIIQVAPGRECPTKYRKADLHNCDHCHTRRFRKDTFVLRNEKTGTYKQIGRQCVRDFIGYKNPNDMVWFFELGDALSRFTDSLNRGITVTPTYGVEHMLAQTVMVIGRRGYFSRKMVEEGRASHTTSGDVASLYYQRPIKGWEDWQMEAMNPSDAAKDEASKVIAWVKAWDAKKVEGNEFNYNVRKFIDAGLVRIRDFGYLACLPFLYKRELGLLEAKKAKKNEHYGMIGERVNLKLTLKRVMARPGFAYGTTAYFMTFEDAEGRTFKWITGSMNGMTEGETWEIAGRVKKHDVWNDWKQTCLTRCKVIRCLDK